jgi:hypothetical protein
MCHQAVLSNWTDISEEQIASIFRIEEWDKEVIGVNLLAVRDCLDCSSNLK